MRLPPCPSARTHARSPFWSVLLRREEAARPPVRRRRKGPSKTEESRGRGRRSKHPSPSPSSSSEQNQAGVADDGREKEREKRGNLEKPRTDARTWGGGRERGGRHAGRKRREIEKKGKKWGASHTTKLFIGLSRPESGEREMHRCWKKNKWGEGPVYVNA